MTVADEKGRDEMDDRSDEVMDGSGAHFDRDDEVIQVVLHPALRDAMDEWLEGKGLSLLQIPTTEDDLPTFIVDRP